MSYQQTIYNLLRQAGMTEAGALGVIGNFECESNCEPYRLQGDYAANRLISKEYVRRADEGQMTETEFAKPVGFGLAQWTYPQRKRNLWKFWKAYGGSLGNVQMQTEFAIKEFKTDFIPDWRLLCSTSDIREAAKAVCDRFENPAIHNWEARQQAALRIKGEIILGEWEKTEIVVPNDPEKKLEFWPPRVLCKGMTGADVEVLQAVLKARDFLQQNPDGIFGEFLEEKVRTFQKSAFPNDEKEWDGIVGNKTWGKLLERG